MGPSRKTILLAHLHHHNHSHDHDNGGGDNSESINNILKVMDIIKDALNKQVTQRGIAEERAAPATKVISKPGGSMSFTLTSNIEK